LDKQTIGFAMCGSFCTFKDTIPQIKLLNDKGYEVIPIMSQNAYTFNTRFGAAKDFIASIEDMCNKNIIHSIEQAEPIGPKSLLDAMIIAPCTGNSASKISLGITDTSVTMSAKAHLRNEKPLIIAISTNDALGLSAKNIGLLHSSKNIYFVPYKQDSPQNKPSSMVAEMDKIHDTLISAMKGKQLQPMIIS